MVYNKHNSTRIQTLKIGLESVRQEQNVESEMVSGKVFRTGAVMEPSHTIYTFPLQFRGNDAVPEEA